MIVCDQDYWRSQALKFAQQSDYWRERAELAERELIAIHKEAKSKMDKETPMTTTNPKLGEGSTAEELLIEARDVLEALVDWNDKGSIDESWWKAARALLKKLED